MVMYAIEHHLGGEIFVQKYLRGILDVARQ